MKFPKIIRTIIVARKDVPIEEIREDVEITSGGQVQVPDKPDRIEGNFKSWHIKPDKNQRP